jgi:hypothetical protein
LPIILGELSNLSNRALFNWLIFDLLTALRPFNLIRSIPYT